MKKRVLSLVLHSFETDSRVLRACSSLCEAGFSVKVVALHEGTLPLTQRIGDIQVERVRLWTRSGPKWRPFQFVKYFEWCLQVAWRFRSYEIIHCNDLNTLPAGVLLKALTFGRSSIVYDAHEFESNHKAGQSRFGIRLLQLIEGGLIRFADSTVTVSEGIADEYARIYDMARPAVVVNCPRRMQVSGEDRFRRRFGIRQDQTIFLTQGWLRPNRGIELMLETFSAMTSDANVLVVMGRGILEEQVNACATRSPNIFHHPVVPPEDVLVHTASADYGIALIYGASFSYLHCLPNKLFEYLAAGLPVIVSDLPEMSRFVRERDLGVVCSEFTSEALTQSCNELLFRGRSELVENVRRASEQFNWNEQQKTWLEVVRRVAV